jgi:hypothetical protein
MTARNPMARDVTCGLNSSRMLRRLVVAFRFFMALSRHWPLSALDPAFTLQFSVLKPSSDASFEAGGMNSPEFAGAFQQKKEDTRYMDSIFYGLSSFSLSAYSSNHKRRN